MSEEHQPKPDTTGFLSIFREHPTFALTLVYLLLSAFGFIAEILYYRPYGINIINYIEVSDFFLFAFKRLETLGFGIITVLYIILSWGEFPIKVWDQMSSLIKNRINPWNLIVMLYWVAMVGYVLFVLAFSPFYQPTKYSYTVMKSRNQSQTYQGTLIGTTDRYLFFSDSTEAVSIYPYHSIRGLTQFDDAGIEVPILCKLG